MNSTITLEQWLTFRTIVDEGSFSLAAEALNKSQSSISYLMSKLNDQLPTPALIQKGRKAQLTEAGQVLYRQACHLLTQAQQIEITAKRLAQGWEDEVVIALDALASTSKVFCGLQQFSEESPTTRVRVLETTLSGTEEAILSKSAHISITAHVPPGFLGEPLDAVTMIPVAAPNHTLNQLPQPATEADLRNQRQIVLRDSGTKRQQNSGWLGSDQRWTVSHFSSSIEAVKAGLGFAFVPEHKITSELAAGNLKQIPLTPTGVRQLTLYLVVTDQFSPGPATQAIARYLVRTLKTFS